MKRVIEHRVSLSYHLLPVTRLSPNPKLCPCRCDWEEPPCWGFFPFFPWECLFLLGGAGCHSWYLKLSVFRCRHLSGHLARKQQGAPCQAAAGSGLGHCLFVMMLPEREDFFICYCFAVFAFPPACPAPGPSRSPGVLRPVMPVPGQKCSRGLWQGFCSVIFIKLVQNTPCHSLFVFLFHPRMDLYTGGSKAAGGFFFFLSGKAEFCPAAC